MDRFFRSRGESVLTSLLYVVLGLVLVLYPATSGRIFCWILGAGALIFAVVQALSAWSARRAGFSAPGSVIAAIGLLCLAIVCFSAPELLLSLLPFVLGGLLALDGITRLPMAWDAVQNRIPMAWLMILITALPLVLGVVLLFRPFTVVTSVIRFFGVSIILGGVLDLAGTRLR